MKKALIALAFILVPVIAQALPPGVAQACGNVYQQAAQNLAAAPNGSYYSYYWILDSVTAKEVVVSLIVEKPTGALRYDGFKCRTKADKNGSGGSRN